MHLVAIIAIVALAPSFALAQSPVLEGIPVKIGDTVDEVRSALHTSLDPEPVTAPLVPGSPTAPRQTEIRLKTRGIWVIFSRGRAVTIRLDAPFSGSVGTIKIGDNASRIEKNLGKPVKRYPWLTWELYYYYIDDVTTLRFVVNRDDEVETILLNK